MIPPRARRLVRLAWKSLWLHRLRSVLTALGMVFGVGAVVAMLAIGEGASVEAQDQIRLMGSRNVILNSVKPPAAPGAASGFRMVVAYGLTLEDRAAIEATVPGLARVVPRRDMPGSKLWNGGRNMVGTVFGTEPAYTEVTHAVVSRGRFLTDVDAAETKNVCVIGAGVAERLFPAQDPLEGSVRVAGDHFRVVGVLARRGTTPASGAGASGEEDDGIFVPLRATFERYGRTIVKSESGAFSMERIDLHQLHVETRGVDDVPPAASALRTLLERRHPKGDVRLTVPLELLEVAARTKQIYTIVLGSIAAISLIVGGIGIMNIMLASVTERTREIGIRRALGARRRDVVGQFLAETVLLSGAGGLVGLLLGVAVPSAVTWLAGMRTVVTPLSLVMAFAISAGVGIVFGLYPAQRAADLDPVEALRHD